MRCSQLAKAVSIVLVSVLLVSVLPACQPPAPEPTKEAGPAGPEIEPGELEVGVLWRRLRHVIRIQL